MLNYPKTFEELLQYYLLHVLTLARASKTTQNGIDRHNLARQTFDMLEGLTEEAENLPLQSLFNLSGAAMAGANSYRR
jgi:hypothetical protein